MSEPRRGRRWPLLTIAAAIAALGVVAAALNLAPAKAPAGPFKGQPMPAMFADHALEVVTPLIAAPEARAHRDAAAYLALHPSRDDAAFTTFALSHVGDPPSASVQHRELAELHRIDAGRTPTGAATARWLEAHGKKDIWKLYVKQYGQQVDAATAKTAKAQFKATYELAVAIAEAGKTHFARPSPYITDPSLHALNQGRFGMKYSYPAKHAVLSFAFARLLAADDPHRVGEYDWMAKEVVYSRMYAGGHYPSDVSAGVYLGTLIADYERALPLPQ